MYIVLNIKVTSSSWFPWPRFHHKLSAGISKVKSEIIMTIIIKFIFFAKHKFCSVYKQIIESRKGSEDKWSKNPLNYVFSRRVREQIPKRGWGGCLFLEYIYIYIFFFGGGGEKQE